MSCAQNDPISISRSQIDETQVLHQSASPNSKSRSEARLHRFPYAECLRVETSLIATFLQCRRSSEYYEFAMHLEMRSSVRSGQDSELTQSRWLQDYLVDGLLDNRITERS